MDYKSLSYCLTRGLCRSPKCLLFCFCGFIFILKGKASRCGAFRAWLSRRRNPFVVYFSRSDFSKQFLIQSILPFLSWCENTVGYPKGMLGDLLNLQTQEQKNKNLLALLAQLNRILTQILSSTLWMYFFSFFFFFLLAIFNKPKLTCMSPAVLKKKKKSLSSLLGFEIWVESDKAALPLEPLSASFVPHKLYSPSVLASCNRFFVFCFLFLWNQDTGNVLYNVMYIYFLCKKNKTRKNTGEKELIVTVKIKDDLINFLTVSCWVPSGKTRGWGEDEQTVHITRPCDVVHKAIVRNSPLDKQFVTQNVWVFTHTLHPCHLGRFQLYGWLSYIVNYILHS